MDFSTMLKIVLGICLGFGLWYLIVGFLANEFNPMSWTTGTKVIYLVLGLLAVNSILKGSDKVES